MTECNGCGACCDPVASPFSPAQLQRLLILAATGADNDAVTEEDVTDFRFMLDHMTPLDRLEGLRRAPYMTNGGRTSFVDPLSETGATIWTQFYSCEFFDTETRQCLAYDQRPPMCSGFPWYDQPPSSMMNAAKALPHECSFRADIGQPVTIRRK